MVMSRCMQWHEIREKYPPEDTWLLVRNSAGFYAAVNEITENTRSGEFRGWTISPEQENLVIDDIQYWAVIEPPNKKKKVSA